MRIVLYLVLILFQCILSNSMFHRLMQQHPFSALNQNNPFNNNQRLIIPNLDGLSALEKNNLISNQLELIQNKFLTMFKEDISKAYSKSQYEKIKKSLLSKCKKEMETIEYITNEATILIRVRYLIFFR